MTDASDLTVTILTGHRPELLSKTLEALPNWLWDEARFVVYHNGVDAQTRSELEEWDFDVLVKGRNGDPLPIGPAASTLLRHAGVLDTTYTLYLEDDWVFDSFPHGSRDWLINAVTILENRPEVGVVRLRKFAEPTLPKNMITGDTIRWSLPGNGYRLASNAHYTCNPTLMRTVDLPWPADSERDAMARFEDKGLWTAQLDPGVFVHIGGGRGLRRTMREAARREASVR